MDSVSYWLGGSLIQWGASIAVGLPFAVLAVRSARLHQRAVSLRSMAQLAGFFLVSLALTRLGPFWTFMRSPWQAMVLEAACALMFIFVTRSLPRAGLTLRISAQAWRSALAASGLMLLFVALRSQSIRLLGGGQVEATSVNLEYLMYQLTMPGIAEELSYRGVIQPGLNTSLGRPWKVLGAQVGWGWVITSVVFWGTHAFRVGPAMQFSFYWPTLTMQLIAGFLYGWIRERTGSVFPPMLAHNLVNVCWMLV